MTLIRHNIFTSVYICILITLSTCFGLQGCSSFITTPLPQDPAFTQENIQTSSFKIYTQQKFKAPGQAIVFYIEGDGRAWVTRNQLSTDPTPVSTLVRKLAFGDPRANVVYLARPCQYIGTFDTPCNTENMGEYWSEKRFAPEIIASMDEAINQVKNKTHAQHIILIGYSGGGAVAALLAARRQDVIKLITIAGNLDTEMHSKIHDISPLEGSLNPRDFAHAINTPQIHYSGAKDDNIPPAIARSFVDALPSTTDAKIIIVPEATHNDGWDALAGSF